jgi:hypothetical protein
LRYSTSLRQFIKQRAPGIDLGVDPDRLASSVRGPGIGLTLQRVLDASFTADTFSEGS